MSTLNLNAKKRPTCFLSSVLIIVGCPLSPTNTKVAELLPGSAGGVRGIGGSVEDNVDPLVWHGCESRDDGSLSVPLCSWQAT